MGRRIVGPLVILMIVGGLVTTACSKTTVDPLGSARPPTMVEARFVATDAAGTTSQLVEDATALNIRLRTLGIADTATVRDRAVEVLGPVKLPVPTSNLTAVGLLQIRPALCQAPPYAPAAPSAAAGSLPTTCSSSRYSLRAPNLTVNVASGVSNQSSIAPDPTLAAYPSSSAAYDDSHPGNSVLIPVDGESGVRCLLGPAALSGTAVVSAQAAFANPQWFVDVTLTASGATRWDAVARDNFHQIIGIDVDGRAVSLPLIQPTDAEAISFDGRMEISGPFTKRTAQNLAADLASGPLATPLSS